MPSATATRAAGFSASGTESSRSRHRQSAPAATALSYQVSLWPGTEITVRYGFIDWLLLLRGVAANARASAATHLFRSRASGSSAAQLTPHSFSNCDTTSGTIGKILSVVGALSGVSSHCGGVTDARIGWPAAWRTTAS